MSAATFANRPGYTRRLGRLLASGGTSDIGILRALQMLSLRGCGSLGEECLCYGEPGDCPRGELMYWREIWLERVNS